MNLSLIRSMTRSAVFELENGLCFRPAHPFTVTLNGETIYDACNTNVFSLFSLLQIGPRLYCLANGRGKLIGGKGKYICRTIDLSEFPVQLVQIIVIRNHNIR